MKKAVKEISHLYEKNNPAWKVLLDVEDTREAVRKMETSAPIDVILTEKEEDLDLVQQKGLIFKDTRIKLAADEAFLIAGANSSVVVKQISDLNTIPSIAVSKGTTPMGKRIRKYLKEAGILESVQTKFVEAKDVSTGLKMIENGTAQVTFAYATNIDDFSKYRILLVLPEKDFLSYTYSAAVARTTRDLVKAKEFLETLRSTSAKKIFENAGFQLPGVPPRQPQPPPLRAAQSQSQPQSQSQSQSQTQSQSQPQSQTQPQSQSQSQMQTQPQSQSQPQSKPQSQPQ